MSSARPAPTDGTSSQHLACDPKRRRVVDVRAGRREADLAGYLRSLRGREQVRVVCIDLSQSYRQLVRRWFQRAVIVADRFHAIRPVS